MLRAALALLVAANLLFLAWTHGWLVPVLGAPHAGEREPGRLAAQVNPAAVQVLPAQAASAPSACLESGPYSDADVGLAEAALLGAGIAASEWERRPMQRPAAPPLPPPLLEHWLRAEPADADLQSRLLAVPPEKLAHGFAPCKS